jgi:hypothetical protein
LLERTDPGDIVIMLNSAFTGPGGFEVEFRKLD